MPEDPDGAQAAGRKPGFSVGALAPRPDDTALANKLVSHLARGLGRSDEAAIEVFADIIDWLGPAHRRQLIRYSLGEHGRLKIRTHLEMISLFPAGGDEPGVAQAIRAEVENALVRLLRERGNGKSGERGVSLSPSLDLAFRQYDRSVLASERQRHKMRDRAHAAPPATTGLARLIAVATRLVSAREKKRRRGTNPEH